MLAEARDALEHTRNTARLYGEKENGKNSENGENRMDG
jgi:hypothetical protein